MGFRERYVAYLNQLQSLARKHDEVTDTEVRERLHEVINYFFIWDKPLTGFPKRFAMTSDSANRALAEVTRAFVLDARSLARAARVAKGAARHALIEDDSAKSRDGRTYDVYLGSLDRVAQVRKPGADSFYSPLKTPRSVQPRYEVQGLAIKLKGRTIVPTFDPKSGMYSYAAPQGHVVDYAQRFYEPEEMRAQAHADLSGDEVKSRRVQAKVLRKIRMAKGSTQRPTRTR